MSKNQITKRRSKINFQNIASPDFKAGLMAELGMSNAYISEATGLTPGQITYRTHQCGIFRRDYRNGVNQTSQLVLGSIGRLLGRQNMVHKGEAFSALREQALAKARKAATE